MEKENLMRSVDKRLTEEDKFSRQFATWANNHKGWRKTKKRNRRLARRKIRRGDWEGENNGNLYNRYGKTKTLL